MYTAVNVVNNNVIYLYSDEGGQRSKLPVVSTRNVLGNMINLINTALCYI